MPSKTHPLDDVDVESDSHSPTDQQSGNLRLLRFSVFEILIAVFVLAFFIATISASSYLLNSLGQIAYNFLTGVAVIGVIILRGERQSFWIGVMVFCLMPYIWLFIHKDSVIAMDSGFLGIVFVLNSFQNDTGYLFAGISNFVWGGVALLGGKIARHMFLTRQQESR